jgi:N utilization substance protein A
LAGVGPKTIEKLEEAGITSLEKLAGMTPEQLMEIPGIGEKMVDKIYQAVNRFYEGGEAAPAGEVADIEDGEESPATETAPAPEAAPEVSAPAENASAEAAQQPESDSEQKEEASS